MLSDTDELWLPLTKFAPFGISYKRARALAQQYELETRSRPGKGGAILVHAPEVVRLHYTESEDQLDPQQERARLAKAQREKVRVETEVLKGALIPREEVRDLLARIQFAAKAKFESLPVKAAAIAETMTKSEIEELLRNLVRDCLRELASGDVERLESGAESDGESVGGFREEVESGGSSRAGPVEH